jgi:hypothetical protein
MSDGYVTHPISGEVGKMIFGGINVPTIALFCSKCGFMMEFSIGVLGLLPKPPDENVKIVREIPEEEKKKEG